MTMIYFHDRPESSAHIPLGGKAAALAFLAQHHLPIPAWFVVAPAAFEQSLSDDQRRSLSAGEIATVFSDLRLNPSIQAELQPALKQLCPAEGTVAVRSSALDEDGMQHSFAGQLDSFLFVKPENVPEQVVAVWKSGFGDRLLAYRQEHQLSPLPSAPAVLIQTMIDAKVAGVAFSANPVTGQRGIAVISAVYGLGTALVSGEADADTYQVNRQGEILERQIAEKAIAHRYAPDQPDALETVIIPPVQAKQPALTDDQVRAIAHLVRRVEQACGRPQDIEWAIDAAGRLFLLQARPITTLAQVSDPDGVLNLWDNSNIAESYGGITTALTFSFARRAYEEVYREFCRMMGVPAGAIAQHDHTFRCMLGLVRGRIYYNLLNWYRVLALLPGFTVNRQFMEQMMGVKEELPPDVLAQLQSASWRDRLQDSVRLLRTILGLIKNNLTLPRQIQHFQQRLDLALSLPQSELEAMRPDELAAYYRDLERQLLTRWDAPLVNDFFAMIFYGVLRKLTVNWCGDTDGTLQNDLISGEGGMISAEPAQRVRELAAIATSHPDWADLLRQGALPQILQTLPDYPDFQQRYQSYLEKFGDRCLEELKLESITLHDNPLLLLRSIGNLATASSPLSPHAVPLTPPPLRQQAETKVQQALHDKPFRRRIFNWVLHNARQRVRDRENLRFERTRLFGRVRRIFVEIGKRFHALDVIHAPQDIFDLEVEEVLGFIDGTTTCTDLKGLVAVRQAEFSHYRELPAPGDRFATHGIVHQGHTFQNPVAQETLDQDWRQGTGCCPGIVRAPVQVITDPQQAQLQQGSILVAERTDPGWIMLFPAAAGLLVERGSLLSHSAIVSREMGIPAIVSIAGITNWLQDGDWVEMNGSTGLVRRIPVQTATVMTPTDAEQAIAKVETHGQ